MFDLSQVTDLSCRRLEILRRIKNGRIIMDSVFRYCKVQTAKIMEWANQISLFSYRIAFEPLKKLWSGQINCKNSVLKR